MSRPSALTNSRRVTKGTNGNSMYFCTLGFCQVPSRRNRTAHLHKNHTVFGLCPVSKGMSKRATKQEASQVRAVTHRRLLFRSSPRSPPATSFLSLLVCLRLTPETPAVCALPSSVSAFYGWYLHLGDPSALSDDFGYLGEALV